MRLLDFIKRLASSFTKDELKQGIRLLTQSLQKAVESFMVAETTIPKFKSKAGKDFEVAMGKAVRLPPRITVLAYIRQVLTTMTNTADLLAIVADKSYGNDVVVEGITYKRAELLRTLSYMDFVSSYSIKLLHMLTVAETSIVTGEHSDGKERPKPEMEWLRDHQKGYFALLQTFAKPGREISQLIDAIPDISIGPDDDKLIVPQVGLAKLDPLKNNAIPLVTNASIGLGMFIVKIQLYRYDYLKDTARSIQLRLEQLRLQAEGTNDAQLQRTIEKYEQYLDKTAEKVTKMEEKYL